MPESAVRDIIQYLVQQSHAGRVLVSAALLADYLEKLLLIRMRTLSNNEAKRIF
jgi:hypothetical protein